MIFALLGGGMFTSVVQHTVDRYSPTCPRPAVVNFLKKYLYSLQLFNTSGKGVIHGVYGARVRRLQCKKGDTVALNLFTAQPPHHTIYP